MTITVSLPLLYNISKILIQGLCYRFIGDVYHTVGCFLHFDPVVESCDEMFMLEGFYFFIFLILYIVGLFKSWVFSWFNVGGFDDFRNSSISF